MYLKRRNEPRSVTAPNIRFARQHLRPNFCLAILLSLTAALPRLQLILAGRFDFYKSRNQHLPFESFSLLMISTSANSGFGAAPPYSPNADRSSPPPLQSPCTPTRAGRRTAWEIFGRTVPYRRPARNPFQLRFLLLDILCDRFAAHFFVAFKNTLTVSAACRHAPASAIRAP